MDGALGRPTGLAFSIIASVLRTEDDDYFIDTRVDNEILRADDGHLSRRHGFPVEAAELLDATRSRIAWLEGQPDLSGQLYKLDVLRQLEEGLKEQ